MAHSLSNQHPLVDPDDDLALSIRTIQRDRKLKIFFALAVLVAGLLVLGLASYKNLTDPVDPGPPGPKTTAQPVQPFVPPK